jgi:PelA/Pel-15E family pectate lyase
MRHLKLFMLLALTRVALVHAGNAILSEPVSFYGTDEAKRIAENLLVYQHDNGGWPKNYDWKKELTEADKKRLLEEKKRPEDTTFDNAATHSEIRFLDKMFQVTKKPCYKEAALKGLHFILRSQYPNGGFPQFPCRTKGYYIHVTYNDGAMIGVLTVLKQISERQILGDVIDEALRKSCEQAVKKGIDCILKSQIRVEGKPALWCAQHDKETLAPVIARSYELPSFSGSESVGIVRFLMSLETPSPEIIASIEGAIAFFERLKLKGIRVESKRLTDGTSDAVVVDAPDAKPMWARFYDLKTLKPIFCSRDGVPREKLSDISFERRNGYSWLGYYAASLLEKDYPAWKIKNKCEDRSNEEL